MADPTNSPRKGTQNENAIVIEQNTEDEVGEFSLTACINGDYFLFTEDNGQIPGKFSGSIGRDAMGRETLRKGTFTDSRDNTIYSGELKNNRPHGDGEYTPPDGSSYCGGFENGKKNGKGKIAYRNGAAFGGIFANGKLQKNTIFAVDFGDNEGLYEIRDNKMIHSSPREGSFIKEDDIDDDKTIQKESDKEAGWVGLDEEKGIYANSKRGFFRGELDKTTSTNLPSAGRLVDPDNGSIYEGGFKNGEKNGKGRITHKDGDYEEGFFVGGNLVEKTRGKSTLPDGSIYEGEYKDNKENGNGKMTYRNGVTIEGNFLNGTLQEDTISSVNFAGSGGSYEIIDNEINYSFPGESIFFRTSFDNGTIDEYSMIYENDILEADFDRETGWFTIWGSAGVIRISINKKGEFFRGGSAPNAKLSIHGTLFRLDGSTCEGEFRGGKMDGWGRITYKNGDYEEGFFANDKLKEKIRGKSILPDGSIYEGEFRNDKMDGWGRITHENGAHEEGLFVGGVLKEKIREKFVLSDGSIYEGGCDKHGKTNGNGKMTYRNGVTIEGNFLNGRLQENTISSVNFAGSGGSYEIIDNEIIYSLSGGIFFSASFEKGTIEVPVTYNGKIVGEKFNEAGWLTLDEFQGICINSKGEFFRGTLDSSTKLPIYGTLFILDGTIYEGKFENGKKNGEGRVIYKNEGVYEGELENNKIKGKGKMTYRNGVIIEGNFLNGTLDVKTISSIDFGGDRGSYEISGGKITYSFPEGGFFEAQFDGESIKVPVTYNGKIVGEKFNEAGWLTLDEFQGICINSKGEFFRGTLDSSTKLPDKGTLLRLNGTIYEGEFGGGKMNERGKLFYLDGTIYEGEYENGKTNGQGKLFFPDGTTYKGEFKNGKMEGKGRITYRNGVYEEGDFKNNGWKKITGMKFFCSDGSIYEGELENNKIKGKGKMTYRNGVIIVGDFIDGILEENKISSIDFGKHKGSCEISDGKITYSFSEKVSFEAPFQNGSITDFTMDDSKKIKKESDEKAYWFTVDKNQGICVNRKGGFFRGTLDPSTKLPTYGILFGLDRSIYEGEFIDGKMEGRGKITYKNGDVYEGGFKNGEKEGEGRITHEDGYYEEGNFKGGNLSGMTKRKFVLADGSIYEGGFENKKKNGKGRITSRDGSYKKGIFKEDGLIKKTEAKILYPDGSIYEGGYNGFNESGEGKIIYRNEVIIVGNFVNGKLEENKISSVDFGEGRGSYKISGDRITYRLPGGIFFEASFKNGSIGGPIIYEGEEVQVEFNKTTGWLTVDKGKKIYVNREGSFCREGVVVDEEGQKLEFKRTLFGLDGSTLEENLENLNNKWELTSRKLTKANGGYKWYKEEESNAGGNSKKESKLYYIKEIEENGTITETSIAEDGSKKEFELENNGVRKYFRYNRDSHLIGQDILLDKPETHGRERAGQINFDMIDDTRKLCSVNFDKDGFSEGPVTYYSYDSSGALEATVGVDYGKLNEALSDKKITDWDGLSKFGAIVVTPSGGTFEEVQQTLRRVQGLMFKNRAQRGAQGIDGGWGEEINQGGFANLKDFESLKRVRFQKPGARGVASNEVYKSPTKFLETLGINGKNIDSIGEDPISVSVFLKPKGGGHAVTLALDMKKIKKIVKEKGFEGINDSNETLFKCLDSSRLVAKDSYRNALGGVAKHTELVEDSILQGGGSCWRNSTIATIAVAENPELLKGVKSTPIIGLKPASFGTQLPTASAILSNDMSVAQLREHMDISENNKIDLGTGKNLIEHIIYPTIIGELKEFSKTEKLLEEYNKRVQSLREEHLKNKSEEFKKSFEKCVKEGKKELSKEITAKNRETEKKEEKELKRLGGIVGQDWENFSEYLENNSKEFGKSRERLKDVCKDFQYSGKNIKYDPAKTKRAIDLAKTIAEDLTVENRKKYLEETIAKIEKDNRAYVGKSLEYRTQTLQQGLYNAEKLNEHIELLRSEIILSKVNNVSWGIGGSLGSGGITIKG